MIYTMSLRLAQHVDVAQMLLSRLSKDMENFIVDNEHAIREVNALQAESKRVVVEAMRKAAQNNLPDVDAESLVQGILAYDHDPYVQYTKGQSKNWLMTSSKETIMKHMERYKSDMDAFVRTFIKTGALGMYFHTITSMDIQAEQTTHDSFDHGHTVNFEPQVKVLGTDTIEVVEKDTVGLESLLSDIKPQYVSALSQRLHKDIGAAYTVHGEEYYGEHHVKAIAELTKIINRW